MGKTMDNIVCDTIKTAHDCIQFLKEQHLQAETFLALDYIEPGHLDERLREIREPRSTKLLIDVIKFQPPQIKRAVLSAVGNTLVCETDEEARKLAFGGSQRHKVVSFDGTLFQKSGLISGGSSELRAKARRWDEKHVDALRKRKEDLNEKLREQLKTRRKEPDLNDMRANLKGLEYRLKYSKQSKDAEEKRCAELERELAAIKSGEGSDEQAVAIEKRMQERAQRLKKARQESNQIDDEVYKDFCKTVGVDNIRVYEERELAGQEELVKKRMAFQEKRTRLVTQLEFEKSRDTKSKIYFIISVFDLLFS
jgi:structural maintenance of chromosome 1